MSETELLYVAGSGRCGSTLFDRLLDRHPSVVGMGEVHRLCLESSELISRTSFAEGRCGCGATIERCEFWRPVLDELAVREGLDRERWYEDFPTTIVRRRPTRGPGGLGLLEVLLLIGNRRAMSLASRFSPTVREHREMIRNSWTLYDVVAERTGAELVVDSTKNATRMKLLYLARPERTRIIHLVRDGRAVASSARRRTGRSIREAARTWYRKNRNIELASRTIPDDRLLRVSYEELCRDTEEVMERVCGFLGLTPSPAMFSLEARDYHQIPGNPMLFRREETEIVLDERWRAEFGPQDQRDFDAVTGKMSERYGYG